MRHKTGIWIDHKKAVIVSASSDGVTATTLRSDVGSHPRYSGSQEGGGEQKYEARHDGQLDAFFDEVIGRLGRPHAILIFGPGEAKLELNERLRRSKALAGSPVVIETADTLTDPQIVARVRAHYELDR
jgi:hypothetical protein